MIGQTIYHYKITEHLGSGGMGVVYKAQDLKLDRPVALKFLPTTLTSNREAKKRFIQEAKAASRLDHQNICNIYEINETEDGQLFIAMACYEGKTLDKIIEGGQIDIQESIDTVLQIAAGLDKAHQKGIIHRDIKPANILMTEDGVVKILDFGIAKLSGQSRLTEVDKTVGTVTYMSPEQTKGENVDHKTDIWSLGVVLYEMLTGQLPFKGDYEQAIIYSILNEEAIPIDSMRTDVPDRLRKVVDRTLQKEPVQRYQNMTEVITEVKSVLSSPNQPAKEEKSIIVLPFVNMSPDVEQEYFCDGLTEEITADLSQIKNLRVISRNSAMTLKGTMKDTKRIGRELNVQFVLEGSVRKAGNNIRITAQLIDAHNDRHLWAEKYQGTLDDVFDMQEKVSRSILNRLDVKLNSEENQRLGTHAIQDVRAYECFLKARHDIYQLSTEFLDSGLDLVEHGLEITGDNELLYALKCVVYLQYVNTLSKPPETYESLLKKGRQAAETALSINPNSAFAHFSQGTILHQSGNPKGAIRHWKRAVELDPNHSDALACLGYQLIAGGRDPDRARGLIEKSIELDPLTPMISSFMGWVHLFNGDFHQASESFESWRKALDKINSPYQFVSAWAYAAAGNTDESFRIIDKIVHDMPDHLIATLMTFFKRALLGEKQKALATVTEQLKQAAWCDDFFSLIMTDAYALIGEYDNSFYWLEHTIDYGYTNVRFLGEFEPFLENIRTDGRFRALMQKAEFLSGSLEE